MSKTSINQYYSSLDRAIQFGRSKNETSIRNYFWILLNDYARRLNYEVVTEISCLGTKGKKVYPDGILKNLFGLDIGLWESKDEKDDIDEEIDSKLKKGYPFTNILFEDSQTAILFQRGEESLRVSMRDIDALDEIITKFISFKSDTIHKFEDALERFKSDIPIIVETLRKRIEETKLVKSEFVEASGVFLALCKAEINPDITTEDIREMMIQHILTSDIFNRIFDDSDFHRHNNIACELEKLIEILFTYSERKNLLGNIEHYYDAINSTAAGISDHHEKQKFLKVLYETFYKVYNPKGADRLGVVYTPNELVQFMVDGTNHLLDLHFKKNLSDKNVEILDPATGTGTFITAIIDSVPKQNLAYKYKNEIYANEVAILPYYISNLNIEYTFKQKMGYYEEFRNICFVDTLDNTDGLKYSGKEHELFRLSSENTERIHRQNNKKISVIIGNPPYNANQKNENENNKNRNYPIIDQRVKNTYIHYSKAQKTKVYDMYTRFYRWATDRLDTNGVLAFVTNRSFIEKRSFDGFRKCIYDEFSFCYIIDTKSDVRTNPKIAGTTHNIFGIQLGVAVMFLVKKENHNDKCKIRYISLEDDWRKEIKLEWLRNNRLENIPFRDIVPDINNNWINLVDNDFSSFLPLIDKINKETIFEKYSNGVSTNRDEWVYDLDENKLKDKINFFIEKYNSSINSKDELGNEIKWSRDLKLKLKRKLKIKKSEVSYQIINYRPYTRRYISMNPILVDVIGINNSFFRDKNEVICIDSNGKGHCCLVSDTFADLHFIGDTKCLPLYYYLSDGTRVDNITDWGLAQFTNHYEDTNITKRDIFNYIYAVLHNPGYSSEYKLNFKQEFARIPFYKNFWNWVSLGKRLMFLHLEHENVTPYSLQIINSKSEYHRNKQQKIFEENSVEQAMFSREPVIRQRLKVAKFLGQIELDEETTLAGIPTEAWEYRLGNRSAIEWVLDQHKEKKCKDPTILEKFDTYRFADHKERVIELLKKICTVSVETMKILKEMEQENQ